MNHTIMEDGLRNAQVSEYQVLWTTSMHQKIKKFQDGTLRFHLFNKRAMLYDTSGVLVTDSFLSRKTLDIGDEIRLERHLVQIEELISTVERDLSDLYTSRSPVKLLDIPRQDVSPVESSLNLGPPPVMNRPVSLGPKRRREINVGSANTEPWKHGRVRSEARSKHDVSGRDGPNTPHAPTTPDFSYGLLGTRHSTLSQLSTDDLLDFEWPASPDWPEHQPLDT